MRIVCDVDGVLLDFAKGMAQHHNKKGFTPPLSEDPDDWGWNIEDKSLFHSMVGQFQDSSEFRTLDLYDQSAPEAIEVLQNPPYDLLVVSACPPKYLQDRQANLASHGIWIPSSHIVHLPDKVKYILALDPLPQVCIEDGPDNVDAFLEAGIEVWSPAKAKYLSTRPNPLHKRYNRLVEMLA